MHQSYGSIWYNIHIYTYFKISMTYFYINIVSDTLALQTFNMSTFEAGNKVYSVKRLNFPMSMSISEKLSFLLGLLFT